MPALCFSRSPVAGCYNTCVKTKLRIFLVGMMGAGKTTVVRMLATLLRPDAGHARVCGADIVQQADRVRELIGLTGQYAAVDEDLTGFENLLLIGRLLEVPRAAAKRRSAMSRSRSRSRCRRFRVIFGCWSAPT